MKKNKIQIFIKLLFLSIGLSLIPMSKVRGEEISDSQLQKYVNIRNQITENEKTHDNFSKTNIETINKLLENLKSKDAKVRAGAASLIVKISQISSLESVAPALIEALQDENPIVRSNAAESLGNIHLSNQQELIVSALIQALKDKDVTVRLRAGFALYVSATTNQLPISKELPAFTQALKDNNPQVRSYAAKTLEALKEKAAPAVPQLIQVLKEDNNSQVRYAAASALKMIGEKAATAVPTLIQILKEDNNSQVRSAAASALGTKGKEAKSAVPELIEAFKQDDDSKIRSAAAAALGSIGEKIPVKLFIKALKDDDSKVRSAVAYALGSTREKVAVKPLIEALEDNDAEVRESAARGLQTIGKEAAPAIAQLIKTLKDDNSNVRFFAAAALINIGQQYRNQAEKLSNQELETVITSLEKALKALEATEQEFETQEERLKAALRTLKKEKDSRLTSRIMEWMVKHPWFATAIIYLIFFPSLWSSLLLIRPLWLLKINQKLQPLSNIQLPEALGGWIISIPGIIFLQSFTYHPRVLDAWVATHIKVARDNFSQKKTVSNRAEYISLPVVLDKKTVANFSGNDLKARFGNKLSYVLIHAEGGSGKTSLACQLAKWGMSDDINIRPTKHRMLPILIEQELDIEAEGNQAFVQAISGQLQVLIGESEAIPTKLVENLLRQRRILMIVDHFSEMSEATRKQIRPASSKFPANALIVTSRLEESLDNVPKTTLKPLRVSGNQLSSFMEAYLTQRGKRDLFDDVEYFDACRRLSLMVGKRNITALFAKLYAEQMIAKVSINEDDFVDDLPLSIPDLMLGYLNELNRDNADGELDNRTIQKDTKIIAWECLKKTFRPSTVKLDDVVAVLENPNTVNARLQHLEKRLRIIQINEAGRDKVRFALDPLAEYLAGLYLVDSFGKDKDKWIEFINQAKSVGDLDAIQGFLLAVQDCCVNNPEEVADSVVAALSELTGVVLQGNRESLVTPIHY